MNWHWPHFLWLSLLPLVALLRYLKKHTLAAGPAHDRILRGVADSKAVTLETGATTGKRRRNMPRLWLAVLFAIVALARPQWGVLEEPVFTQSREILVAIDLSKSMLTPDVSPSRLERAKLLTRSLLEKLAGERVGLVVFSGTAFLQCPLSTDYEILKEFLPALTPKFLPQGGTDYSGMLDSALDAFSKDGGADHYLIVLSDGEATEEKWRSKLDELKKRSVKVIGLGVGTAAGAMIPDAENGFVKDENGAVVLSKLESATLQELATGTGGTYVDASSWVDLAQVLRNTVESGQKGDFHDTSRQRLAERFQWPLATALFLLTWSLMVEFPVRPKTRKVLKLVQATTAAAAATPKSWIIAILLLGCFNRLEATPAPSQPPTNEAKSAAAPLAAVVKEMSVSDDLKARDWLRLAQATSDYARRTVSAKAEVSERAIRDGLEAVDRGEKADAKAGPWQTLRDDLLSYLKKKDPPPQDQKDKDQKDQKQDQKDQKQDQKNQDQQKDQKSDPSKDQKDQKNDPQKDQKNSDEQKSQDSKQEGSPTPTPAGNQSEQKMNEPSKNQQDAFGKMDQPTPTPETKPSRETQKVGGAPDRKPQDPQQKQEAALTVPLQKLDQVRNQDAPAELYQLMQGTTDGKEPSKGKTW